jgi:hypothetical protein
MSSYNNLNLNDFTANSESMPSQIRAHRHGEFLPYIKEVIKERQGRKVGVLPIKKKRW